MKHYLILLFIAIFCSLGFTKCKTTAVDKQKDAVTAIQTSKKAITQKSGEIEDKGKAFVWGANYALDYETNRSVAVITTDNFLDLARLTLGNPSLRDSKIVKEIVDDLLAKSKEEIARANALTAKSEREKKIFEKEAEKYRKQAEEGDKKLKKLELAVSQLQGQEDLLKGEYDKKIDAAMKLAEEHAGKAAKYDEENTFWASINPLTDLFKFFKKLLFLGIFGGVLFLGFHVLEIFFPALGIISTIGSVFVKAVSKFVPKAIAGAGYVSDKVKEGLKSVTVGLQHTLNTLKSEPIEDKILDTLDEHKSYSKSDIKNFLETHTENIVDLIKREQDEHQDGTTKSLIYSIKTETNLKDGKPINL